MEKRRLPVVDEDVEPNNDDVMKRSLDQMVNDVLSRATKALDAGEALECERRRERDVRSDQATSRDHVAFVPRAKKSEARLFVRRASLAERITTFLALSVERLEVLSFRETVASKLIDSPSQTLRVICADHQYPGYERVIHLSTAD